MKRFGWVLISLCLVWVVRGWSAGPGLTRVQDTMYRADGSVASGTLTITWPEFTTADGAAVAAGSMTVAIGARGAVDVSLAPNAGAVPAGTFYKVVTRDTAGVTASEYWVVPATKTTTLAIIRTEMMPPNVAAQAATKAYVDLVAMHKAGDESVSGVKSFAQSPGVPSPQNTADAASKGYVDATANAALTGVARTATANTFTQQQSMADVVVGGSSPTYIDVRWFGVKGDGKFISDAAMTAGSAALASAMGRFTCPTDVGRTIWVQGAGTSGATLQTTIASCTDSNHVTLAAQAVTTIAPLSVSDGAMTSGSKVLTSASAKFSAAMVGYTIYVPGAAANGGVLQTTVASFTDASHVNLTAAAANTTSNATVSFLFQAVIGTDDTAAIQSAIDTAKTRCNAGGGTWNLCPTLLFPAANYVVSGTLQYKSVPWQGMGPLKTSLLWVGATGGTMVTVPAGYAGGASWGGIKGVQLRMGTNWPKTHIEFDAAVDAGFFLEEDGFLGASGNSIELTQGFVNLHWQKLRWDSIAGYMVRFASAAPCYVASSAVIDRFTADLSPLNNPLPPTNPLGYFLIDNTPANCGQPRTKYKFSDARIENNAVPFANSGAIVALVNTTATGNNGFPVDVTIENITGQNPAWSTVGTSAPMGLYCNVPTDCNTAIVHVRDLHMTGWASAFVVQPPSADFGYGWWPKCAGNCDLSSLDMNMTSTPRITAGNTLINDYVTLQANGKVLQSRDTNHNSAATNYPEFDLDVAGKLQWYAGNSNTSDTNLYRGSAGVLKSDQQISAAGGLIGGFAAVTFSATPAFDFSKGDTQMITLTGNVTSSTLTNAAAGQRLLFIVCQDATGSRTFAWPASVKGGGVIGASSGKCSVQEFVWDGSAARAVGAVVVN
ncbi:hypothetical protein Acid345_4368 [Candidatus Koribacter versatilis Ellin345]|uniref:Pectate lyase superfamily protein domain-containing protein n=1 Tax=Koribacter versatilis (strain Ellin345) TaxID=204669 RepID=Q1IID2_KORVE|nr:hypothetical protein [Candidatus Koribacter versatilis]ABF43368.1 hypothetical protein Acid345_4368 [Candidatus Koribacter versatilis Ellin345]